MNIELTTENLRACCRFCLNKGEFNIWEQTVETTTALDFLQIFQDYENDLLGLNDELKLLCQLCIQNLKSCYEFYKTSVETNKKMKRLFREAQKIEAEQLVDVAFEMMNNDGEREHETENHLYKNDYVLLDESLTNVSVDDLIEEDNYEEAEEEQQIESDSNEREHIDYTNDEIEYLNNCDTDNADIFDCAMSSVVTPLNRKSRKYRATGTPVPSLPPHEDGSLVVTQFLPSTAHLHFAVSDSTEERNLTHEYEDNCGEGEPLSTVDFAAVEVKSSNFQQIIEEEWLLQSPKEDAALSNPETVEVLQSKEDVPESESVYVCKYCPEAFTAINYLISHVRKCHVCKYCTRAFPKSMDLFIHIRQQHHQHKCAICNKQLSSHSNLRGHIKRVHGIRLPAQVSLLHYRAPNEMSAADDISYSNISVDST